MTRPKGSKNKANEFKGIAGQQVQAKKDTHAENGDELIAFGPQISHRILELAIDFIRDNPYQPRRFFDEESLKELAGSIKSHGLLNPVLVHKDEEGYFLVAGERRLRACRQLGMDTIKAVIVEADPEIASLVDNIQREDLHPMERALAVKKLLDRHDGATSRVADIISIGVRSVQHLEQISGLTDMIDATDRSEAVAKLTDNKIPLREFIQLSRYKDRTQLNAKFDELVKKYRSSPKLEPIELKRKQDRDEMEKTMAMARKIKVELEKLVFDKSDSRLTELQKLIKEISQIITNLKM